MPDTTWTRKSKRPEPVRDEVTLETVHRGLDVHVTRYEWGSVHLSVAGRLRGRRVTGSEYISSGRGLSDDDVKARAIALADDLRDAGFRGLEDALEAPATMDAGDHHVYPAAVS